MMAFVAIIEVFCFLFRNNGLYVGQVELVLSVEHVLYIIYFQERCTV